MPRDEIEEFDNFWRVVTQCEEFIDQYGHYADPHWESKSLSNATSEREFRRRDLLGEAYERVRGLLRAISKHKMVHDLPGGLNPFKADNFHHALILFLSPPERWFGNIGVLHSPEYQVLKRKVEAEQSTIEDMSSTDLTKLASDDLNQTAIEILEAMDATPRTWHVIAQKAGYESATVRKYSTELQEAGLIRKTARGFIRVIKSDPATD